jgi:hypothetical protein
LIDIQRQILPFLAVQSGALRNLLGSLEVDSFDNMACWFEHIENRYDREHQDYQAYQRTCTNPTPHQFLDFALNGPRFLFKPHDPYSPGSASRG